MFAVSRAIVARRCLALVLSASERHIVTNFGRVPKQMPQNEGLLLAPNWVLVDSRRPKSKGRQGSTRHSSGRPKVLLKDDELAEVIKVHSYRDNLARILQNLGDSYLKQLSVTNMSGNVESILVNFEASQVQLFEVARIQKKPNLVVLQFTSFPEAIKPAIEAIKESGIRASIQQESTTVYLHFPKMTREQREDMAKSAKLLFQKCKDELLQLERRVHKEIQSNKDGQSQDLIFDAQTQVKYEIEQQIAKAEEMMKSKQNELLKDG